MAIREQRRILLDGVGVLGGQSDAGRLGLDDWPADGGNSQVPPTVGPIGGPAAQT